MIFSTRSINSLASRYTVMESVCALIVNVQTLARPNLRKIISILCLDVSTRSM